LSALLPRGTLVSHQLTLDQVVNFSAGYTADGGPLWEVFCDWRQIWLRDG
jgi:hypothetical protein